MLDELFISIRSRSASFKNILFILIASTCSALGAITEPVMVNPVKSEWVNIHPIQLDYEWILEYYDHVTGFYSVEDIVDYLESIKAKLVVRHGKDVSVFRIATCFHTYFASHGIIVCYDAIQSVYMEIWRREEMTNLERRLYLD